MAKKSSPDLEDILLYGALGVGGIIIASSIFKSFADASVPTFAPVTPGFQPVPSFPAATPVPTAAPAAGVEKIATISTGAPYDINSAVVPGYFTIVKFAADWCPGCQEIKPQIEQFVQSRPNVVMRLVDLTVRDSAAAAQAVQEFKIQGIPYIRVYGPSGQFLGEVTGPNMDQVVALVR